MPDLSGKVEIVTCAGHGIGRSHALDLADTLGILPGELAAVPEEDDTETSELASRMRAGDVLDRCDTGTRSR